MSGDYDDWIELEERNQDIVNYSGFDYLGCKMDEPEEKIDDIWEEFLNIALGEVGVQ